MFILAALLSTPADAGVVVGAEYLLSLSIGNDVAKLGDGVGGRIGLSLDVLAVTVIPEVGATLWLADNRFVPEAGVRVQFLKVLEPGAFAHINRPFGAEASVGWDGGFTLDLTAIPKVDLGLQVGVVNINRNIFGQAGAQVHVNF